MAREAAQGGADLIAEHRIYSVEMGFLLCQVTKQLVFFLATAAYLAVEGAEHARHNFFLSSAKTLLQ